MPVKTKNLSNRIPYYDLVTGNFSNKGLAGSSFGLDFASKARVLFGDNLVGQWKLDQKPSGNNYLDCVEGTYISAGSAEIIDNLPTKGEFTVELWMKNTNNYLYIAHKQYGNPGWALLSSSGTGYLRGFVRTDTNNGDITASDLPVVHSNEWMHVCMYYNDAGDRKPYVSVNGIWSVVTATPATGIYADDSSSTLYISRAGTVSIVGALGWVRISNNDRHGHGVNFTPPSRTVIPENDANTVLLYGMDENYGSVVGNLVTSGGDGAIVNGTWGSYPTAIDSSSRENNGTYTGVNLYNSALPNNVGGKAPFFDGVNDFVNVLPVGSNGFNKDLGSMMILAKVFDIGVYTDNEFRYAFGLVDDGSNYVSIFRMSSNNLIRIAYVAGGVAEFVDLSGTDTGWMLLGATWDKSGNEFKAYKNNSQIGTTQAIAGTFLGALSVASIGSFSLSATYPWHGYLAHAMVLNRVATLEEFQTLSQWAGLS